MRRLLNIFAVSVGCLIAAETAFASVRLYQLCCTDDCKAAMVCGVINCTLCSSPAALPISGAVQL
jgi:hypothetical protein